jgi:hypothetical protein
MYTDPELVKQIQQLEQDLLTAGYSRTKEILGSQENQFLANESRQNRNTQFVMDGINRTQAEIGLLATQAERIQNENAMSFGDLTKELLKVSIDQAKDHALTQKGITDAERILERQASDYANLTSAKFGHLEVQAANNAAAIQLETLRSKADLMQKMTEYYGDLKDKVTKSEDNIKTLINSTDTDRLRDALVSAETRNAVFESRGFNVGYFDWHHGGHHGHHGHHSRSRSRGRD